MLYTYISHSRVPKTYHGVTFYYGDKKEVSGTIRDTRFVFCSSRPNPPAPTIASKPKTKSAEKPKTTRGRKPKVSRETTPKVVEPDTEKPISSDTE